MTDDHQRARELLALGLDEYGHHNEATNVRLGIDLDCYQVELWSITAALLAAPEGFVLVPVEATARPLEEWHDDTTNGGGDSVWFTWDAERGEWLGEPAWIGRPNDSDWPGYHTHWLPHPAFPAMLAARPQGVKDV